jgi:phospholipid transport system substrate-binding protein
MAVVSPAYAADIASPASPAPAVAELSKAPLGASAAAPSSVPAPAVVSGKATEVIKNFYIQLADTMKQGDQLGYAGRYKKLDPAIKSAFNLPVMTRFAVGLEWEKATPDEQKQLISAFSDFSVATYASQFKSYDGEMFKVIDEKPEAEGVLVETQLLPKDGDPIILDYLMKPDEQGNMRIIDVLLQGAISQLAARRSEFTSIVRREGIPALVNSLGDKTRQMGPTS